MPNPFSTNKNTESGDPYQDMLNRVKAGNKTQAQPSTEKPQTQTKAASTESGDPYQDILNRVKAQSATEPEAKKKDGGESSSESSVSPSASVSPSPSPAGATEPVPTTPPSQAGTQAQPVQPANQPAQQVTQPSYKGSIIDQLARKVGYVSRETKPVSDVVTIPQAKIQQEIDKAAMGEKKALTEFTKNPTGQGLKKIAQNVENEKKAKLSNKFYSGDLNEEDITEIVNANPFLKNLQVNTTLMTNQEIAGKVNQKTKNIADAAKVINMNAYNYAFNVKDLDETIYKTQNNIRIAEDDNSGTVFVDPAATNLQGKPMSNGLVAVDRDQFLKEQQNQLEDLNRRKEFITVDFDQNVYQPQVQKVTQDIIRQIENESGKNAQFLDPVYLATEVNKRVRQLKDPILMAKKGVDPNDQKRFFVSATEIQAREGGGNEDYVVVKDKLGNSHTFKNDDYNDVFEEVFKYFNLEKPAQESAQRKVDQLVALPENQKFAPIVLNQQRINEYFSNTDFKNQEAVIKTTSDSAAAFVNKEWENKLRDMPAFQELAANAVSKVQNGDMTEQEANEWLNTMVESDANFKDVNAIRNNKLQGVLKDANNQRMQFIIDGLKTIDERLTYDFEGNVLVQGATRAETKAFNQKLIETYKKGLSDAFDDIEKSKEMQGNVLVGQMMMGQGYLQTAFGLGARKGTNNLMESFARYYDLKDLRNYFTGVNKDDVIEKSQFVKNASTFNGLSSLANPAYYAYNVGQSTPYMLPGAVAGIATGGAGAVIGGFVAGNLETVENMWDTYNEMAKYGKDINGVPLTDNQVARAAANDAAMEAIPNIIIPTLEFGALARGLNPASKQLKTSIGREVAKAGAGLLETGSEEAIQEAVQGYAQMTAKTTAQGQPELDVYDYMQSDDFLQNLFGGFAGGVGFGVGGAAKRIAGANESYNNWKKILETAQNKYTGFNDNVMRSYAIQQEMEGNGSQFRDGVRLRLANMDFKDDAEKNQLLNTLAYSVSLNQVVKELNVAPGNINGIAAAHNIAMADTYNTMAENNKNNVLKDVYKKQANEHKAQAAEILSGNSEGVKYVTTKEGTPIFLGDRDAQALSENGDIAKMMDEGTIRATNVSFTPIQREQQPEITSTAQTATQEQPVTDETVADQQATTTETPENNELYQKAISAANAHMSPVFASGVSNDVENALKEAAQQLNATPEEAANARKVYGDEFSDIAIQLFPNETVENSTLNYNKSNQNETQSSESNQGNGQETGVTQTKESGGSQGKENALTSNQGVASQETTPSVRNQITEEEYNSFVDTGNVDPDIVEYIANKVINQEQFTPQEMSIYQAKSKDVESKVNEKTKKDQVKVSEIVNKPIIYKGERGTVFQDGQALVVRIEGTNREYELGNVNEVSDLPISEFGIDQMENVVSVADNGNIVVRGQEYVNNKSNPQSAIVYDDNGNVIAVNLQTTDGKRRTFRGQVGEDIAYQITLKEITKDNAERQQLEEFINTDEQSRQDLQSVESAIAASQEKAATTPEVQREQAERTIPEQPAATAQSNEQAGQPAETAASQQPAAAEPAAETATKTEPEKAEPKPELNRFGTTSEFKKQADRMVGDGMSVEEIEAEMERPLTDAEKKYVNDIIKYRDEKSAEAKASIDEWSNELQQGKKISKAAVSLLPYILDNPQLRGQITNKFFEYQPNTQADAYAYAQNVLDYLGTDGTREYFLKERYNIPPLYQTALLVKLIEGYKNEGDFIGEAGAATLLREHITYSAQGLQSAKAAYEWLHITNSLEAQKVFVQNVSNDINASVNELQEVKDLKEAYDKLKQEAARLVSENKDLQDQLAKEVDAGIKKDKNATTKQKAKKSADAIRKLKIKTDGNTLYFNPLGAFAPMVNLAIDAIASAVENGGNLIDAVEDAIKKIKASNPKFNQEDELRKYIVNNVKIPASDISTSDYVKDSMKSIMDDFLNNETDFEEAVDKKFHYLDDAARKRISGIIKKELHKSYDQAAKNTQKEFDKVKSGTLDDMVRALKTKSPVEVYDQQLLSIAEKAGLKYVTRDQISEMDHLLDSAHDVKGFRKAERIERVNNFLEQKDDQFRASFLRSVMYLKNLFSYSFAAASMLTNKMQLLTGTTANFLEDAFANKRFDFRYYQMLLDKNIRRKSNAIASDILLRGGIPLQNMMESLQPVDKSIPASRVEEYKITTNKWYKKVFNAMGQFAAGGGSRIANATDSPVTYRLVQVELYQSIKDSIRKNNPSLSEKEVEKSAWAEMNSTNLQDAIKLVDAEYATRGITVVGNYYGPSPVSFVKSIGKTKGLLESDVQGKTIDRSSTVYKRVVAEKMDEIRDAKYQQELADGLKIASDLLFKERVGDSFQKNTPTYKRITNGIGGLVTSTISMAIKGVHHMFDKTGNAGKLITEGVTFAFTGYVNSAGNIMERVLEADPRYAALKIAALQWSKKGLTKEEQKMITKRQQQVFASTVMSAVAMAAIMGIANALCKENATVTKSSRADGDSTTGNLKICGVEIPLKYFPIQARLLQVYASAMSDPKVSEEDKQSIFTATLTGLTHLNLDFFQTDPGQFESPTTKLINIFTGKSSFNIGEKKQEEISDEQWQNFTQRMLAGYSLNYVPIPATLVKQTISPINLMNNEGMRYASQTGEINRNGLLNFMSGFQQQLANQSGYQSVMNTFSKNGEPYLDYRSRVVDKNYSKKRDDIDKFMDKYESYVNMYSQTYSPVFVDGEYRTMTDKEHREFYKKATSATNDWLNANYPQKEAMYKKYYDTYHTKLEEKGKKTKTSDEYFLQKFKTAQTEIKKDVIVEMFGAKAIINQ